MSSNLFSSRNAFYASVIVVGFALLVRLGLQFSQSPYRGEPETAEEFRNHMVKMKEYERVLWEKTWIESGSPPPPGGFDAAWKRARGGMDEVDVHDQHHQPSTTPTSSP